MVNYFYSDFDFSLEQNSTDDVITLTDENSINQSIKNILLTNRGEVFFDPLFGSGIRQLLFEKMNSITEILLKNEIIYSLENYEPRIKINNIDITSDIEALTYHVSIDYIILKLNTVGSVDVILRAQAI